MKQVLRKIPFLVSAKKQVLKALFGERNRRRAVQSFRISTIDRKVRKALCLKELVWRAPASGVIVECGVAFGWSLGLLGMLSQKKIYGFDSYEGFPAGSSKDAPSFDPELKWKYKLMTEKIVEENLVHIGISPTDVGTRLILKKGFFPASFEGFNERVSLVHLDVDLYQSYKDALNFFFPLLEQEGFLAFDEYDLENDVEKWPGAKIAIDEFASENNLKIEHHWTGFAYIKK